jgi:uroporphyrinogen-III decarboxylase
MEIKEVKEHLRGKAWVLGNIDCTYLLPFGEKEAVVESVKKIIRQAAPRRGIYPFFFQFHSSGM